MPPIDRDSWLLRAAPYTTALALCIAASASYAGARDSVIPSPVAHRLAMSRGPIAPTIRPIAQLKLSATIRVGKTADWVVISSDAVWVGSTGPDAVNAIDPASNQRIASVQLPGEPCAGLALGFGSLWVPLCGSRPGLAQVDLKTRTLRRVLDLGPAAPEGGIAVGAGSVWLVVDKAGSMARIDPNSGAVRQTVQLPPGSYNPLYGSGRIWVTRAEDAEITSVDAATGKVLTHIRTGPGPRFLTAGDNAVWTLNQGDGSLTRIDVNARQEARTLALGTPGHGGDITYGAGRIWSTFPQVPLTIVAAAVPALLCQWKGPGGDSLGFGHGAIWLTNYSAGTISRIALSDIPSDCSGASSHG